MYCPNCGKKIYDDDNFCRYCGTSLNKYYDESEKTVLHTKKNINEEYVLYEIKKHTASLFWSIILAPFCIFYFCTVFLNNFNLLSIPVMVIILGFIFYPVCRYKSDKIVLTNKYIHIRIGVINPEERDIPIERLEMFEVTQGAIGQLFGFGSLTIFSETGRINYGYIEAPEDLQYIIDNPEKFIKDSLEMSV